MQKRAEKTRLDILEAAELEFAEKGYYGARMDVIAKTSGANKSLIYRYFGDKDALYKVVFYSVYDRFSRIERMVFEQQGLDWREKLRKFIKLDFEFLAQNPTYVRLLMWENLNHAKCYKERKLKNPKGPIIQALEVIIKEAASECKLHETVNSHSLLQTIYACGFNYFTNMDTMSDVLSLDLRDPEVMAARIRSVSDMIIAYLGG